jgi:energy-coupling factor transporter ATP-binding protein EcfA2
MYVKSVKLENLKGFPALYFNLERPDGSYSGWTVFLGGNASGKSTLLKCIALALLGPTNATRLLGAPVGWIRDRAKRTEISVQLERAKDSDTFVKRRGGPPESIEAALRIFFPDAETESSGGSAPADAPASLPALRAVERRVKDTRIRDAETGPWNQNARGWFCCGYGPMRRLSGHSTESIRIAAGDNRLARFVTLFREDAALSESERWLTTNHSRLLEAKAEKRDDASELTKLLDGVHSLINDDLLPHGMVISRVTVDHVYVKDGRSIELPMRDISDGCRSIYATVLDLVHSMAEAYGADNLFATSENGRVIINHPGVVLIDEIEAHLHPAWQRDIPQWLKVHFPRVQFLVGTHSPLVAQAVDPGGAFLLPSPTDRAREPRRLDDNEVEKLRLGQALKTLLGTAFGLDNTRSHWANAQIQNWKRIKARKEAGEIFTKQEQHEYDKLHEQMSFALSIE